MNLVVSAITMVDLTNKEAKRVYFSPGKNLITSAHNHLGKSVIMKSIYYTLGAEVYYPNPIKKLNLLAYIDFSLNTHQHRVARLKSTFILYCDGSFRGCYSSVNEFDNVQVAELADTSIRYVGALERGEKSKPSADLVSRFSIILEVPVEDLMSTSDEAMKAKADSQRITVSPRFLQTLTQFRIPKLVSDLMIFPDTSFFVCPQCGITLEREFMKYCDCCGQCLNWKNYKHPRIVYPGSHGG